MRWLLTAGLLLSASLAHAGYSFTGATSVIRKTQVSVAAVPMTMFARFRMVNYLDGLDHTLGGVFEAAAFDGFRMGINTIRNLVCIQRGIGVAGVAFTSTAIGDNNDHRGLCVFATDASRTVYLDNGGSASNTDLRVPGVLTKTVLGARDAGGAVSDNVGHIVMEFAIWNVATLDATDRTNLQSGVSPTVVKAASLVMYWRGCNAIDVFNATLFTITDVTKVECAQHRVVSYLERMFFRQMRAPAWRAVSYDASASPNAATVQASAARATGIPTASMSRRIASRTMYTVAHAPTTATASGYSVMTLTPAILA